MNKELNEIEVNKIREDFPMFSNVKEMQGKRFDYLDNSATTFKPSCVLKAADSYYEYFCANTHRGDYDIAHKADTMYLNARKTVANFIHADPNEVVFTAGDSLSMNMIALGLLDQIHSGDEIVISEAEHASNVLPWFTLARLKGAIVKYAKLDKTGTVTPKNLKEAITPKTKIVSLAQVTNVLGSVVDIKTCAQIAHNAGALFVCDAAQSAPHMAIDVKDLDVDFLAFSGHKMCGPTGIGVLFGKYDLLKKSTPILSGGGMNARFNECGNVSYELPPYKFEAGTQNISGAIGLAKACEYLSSIGLASISRWEKHLRDLVIKGIKGNPNVIVYNPTSSSGILDFNVKKIFSQDEATLLNSKGICVRSGLHCAKILPEFLKVDSTVRASFYFYNNEEDAMQLVQALNEGGDFLDAYFN